jgi:hypothetical protein
VRTAAHPLHAHSQNDEGRHENRSTSRGAKLNPRHGTTTGGARAPMPGCRRRC